jgi:hypothetical protein
MVRVIADISVHSPTASSCERYKYQHGYQKNMSYDNRKEQIVYHPSSSNGGGQKQSKKHPSSLVDAVGYVTGGGGGGGGGGGVENNEKMGKAKEKESEVIHKLGRIIYRTRTGDVFEALHSTQASLRVVLDKITLKETTVKTHKIVWNNQVFETKQACFSAMANFVANRVDVNMEIARCE